MTPAVSVVIPTYNRRRPVGRAVASVLEQQMRDFELIVVDDGSEDGTGEALAGLDDRLRYEWRPRGGPAAARNTGIQLARAPVVAFLDADNRWLPDHLETVHALLERHSEALLASTCPRFRIGGEEDVSAARVENVLAEGLFWNRVGYVSGVAVRREALVDAGGFDEDMEVGEDDDLWLRLALKGPVASLRRRTIVRRHTHGGLRDRGRRSGAYTDANTRSIERLLPQLEDEGLRARARARLHMLAAVGAVQDRDAQTARAELAQACELFPRLQRHSGPLLGDLWKSAHDRRELRQRVEAASAAMPDQEAYTALFLRGYAAVLSATHGRLWKASTLVLRRPHLVRPRFLRRAARPAGRLTRKRLVEIVSGGRESSLAR